MPTGAYTNSSTAFSTGAFSSDTAFCISQALLSSESTVPGTMSVLEAALLMVSAFLAGTINTIVGSGSLITFPTLLAIGYSPVIANVSNTVGISFGSLSGAVGYRRELVGQRRRVLVLGSASLIGGLIGGMLLLTLPSSVFDAVVPVLILIAVRAGAAAAATEPFGGRAAQPGRRARRHRAVDRHLRHRRVRRLLRRRAGRDPARAARHLHRRRPAATQRR